jgi:LacI family transcriptional regulator
LKDSLKIETGKRPTIVDLARQAGVSVSTVDRVLNGRSTVRRDKAEKVLAAAKEIGFYATGLIRSRIGPERPAVKLGFLLQQQHRLFFQQIGDALAEETRACPTIDGTPRVLFVDDIEPATVSNELLKLGRTVDAVALIAGAHPHLSKAIDTLHDEGIPVFGVITELSATRPVGFVGLDNWKVGRQAAWAIAHMAPRPGKVGIIFGSHRYRCQELNEMGFRSFFREQAPDFTVLEPGISFEDERVAAEVFRMMMARDPDMVGLYIAGGGVSGVIKEIGERAPAPSPIIVCHELTVKTREALLDGTARLVISHPLPALARTLVEAMSKAIVEKGSEPVSTILPFDVFTSENV